MNNLADLVKEHGLPIFVVWNQDNKIYRIFDGPIDSIDKTGFRAGTIEDYTVFNGDGNEWKLLIVEGKKKIHDFDRNSFIKECSLRIYPTVVDVVVRKNHDLYNKEIAEHAVSLSVSLANALQKEFSKNA